MKKLLSVGFAIMFTLTLIAQPPNDDCLDATPLTNLNNNCTTHAFTDATFSGQDGSCDPSWADPANVWFTFEAQGPNLDVGTSGPDGMKITLVEFDGACEGIKFLACASPFIDINYIDLEIGQTYYLIVSNEAGAVGNFTICINNPELDPPPNDDPCDAIPLTNNASDCGTTVDAGLTFNPNSLPCPSISTNTIWYTVTIPNASTIVELEFSTTLPGNIQVIWGQWDGGCSGTFFYDPENAYCGNGNTTQVYSCLEPGTYHFMVSTAANNQGEICVTASIGDPPPGCGQNSDCNSPEVINLTDANEIVCVPGCNVGACGEAFGFQGCNYSGGVVWYQVTTPPGTAVMNVTVTSPDLSIVSPQVQVFNDPCGGGAIGGCNTGGNGSVNVLGINIIAGSTYYIAVTNATDNPGNFEICVSATDPQTACLLGASLTVNSTSLGSPETGPFFPGEQVSFTFDWTFTSVGNGIQWPHAVIPIFGNCWDLGASTLPNYGNWTWFDAGVVTYNETNSFIFTYTDPYSGDLKMCFWLDPTCDGQPLTPGATLPAGWYHINQPGQCGTGDLGNPNNTWGQPCGGTCGNSFTFVLTTVDVDTCEENPETLDCGMQFFVMSDYQTGCWMTGSPGTCLDDFPLFFQASLNCCRGPIVEPDFEEICSGETTNIEIFTNEDGPGTSYWWNVVSPPGVFGASPGTGKFIRQTLTNNSPVTQTVIYLVEAEGPTGCPSNEPDTILVDVFPRLTVEIESDPSDGRGCATTPFFLEAEAEGGSGQGFQYNWSTGDVGPSITTVPGVPGTYSYRVTVTDAQGCEAETLIEIIVSPNITAELQIDTTDFCAQIGPKILSVLTEASTIVDVYDWDAPFFIGNNPTATIGDPLLHSGTYSITITDINGCTGDDQIEINVYPTPEFFTVSSPPDDICVDDDVPDVINFNDFWFVFQGGPIANEVWSGTAAPTFDGRIFPEFMLDGGPGTYTVQWFVESIHGCVDSIDHVIELLEPPILNLQVPEPLCATAPPLELEGLPDGGVWSGPGVADNMFDPQLAGGEGDYMVYYRLEDGSCVSNDSMIVTVNPPPDVRITEVEPLCFDVEAFDLEATPEGGEWVGFGVNEDGVFDPQEASEGTHTITYIYEEGGCLFPASIDIEVYPELAIDVDFVDVICLDENSIIQFTGVAPNNTNFIWSTDDPSDNIVNVSGGGNAEIEWNSHGDKTVTLSISKDGCVAGPEVFNVEVELPLESPDVICAELTTTSVLFTWDEIERSTGYSIDYDGDVIIQNETEFFVEGIDPGAMENITITVIALGDGVCGDSDPTTIGCQSEPCPDIVLTPDVPAFSFCLYDDVPQLELEININGSDGSGIGEWSGHPDLTADGTFDVQSAGPGSYELTYTFIEQECTYTSSVTVNMYAPPVPSWASDLDHVCINEPIIFTYTGDQPNDGTSISWSFADGSPSTGMGEGPITVDWSSGGDKEIVVTIADDFCEATYSDFVLVEEPLSDPVINCGASTVSVTFFWDPVPGAVEYIVTIDGGPEMTFDANDDLEITIDDLDQEQTVVITVQAIGSGVCGNSNVVVSECTTRECPPIDVTLRPVDPICLYSDVDQVQLEFDIVGSTMENEIRFQGPGIVDIEQGIFDPAVAGIGTHTVSIRLIEDFCPYTNEIDIVVLEVPNPEFNIEGPICINETTTATYSGNATNDAEFTWTVDGGEIVMGQGTPLIQVRWATSGTKRITLTVTENGCTSDLGEREIEVEDPLPAPIISCEVSNEAINFTWTPVPGATGYRVTVNGNTFETTDLNFTIEGLDEGDERTIIVVAIGDGPCGDSEPAEQTCETERCPEIDLSITPLDFICLDETTGTFNLEVILTGEVGEGDGSWSGAGITDEDNGVFDPTVSGIGTHTVTYTYRERFCLYEVSSEVDVRPVPTSEFSVMTPVCIDQISDIMFEGIAGPSATFEWNLGQNGNFVSGEGTRMVEGSWSTMGDKTVTLAVEENGCRSEVSSEVVSVERRINAPALSCNSTLTSITFNWNDVAGNDGYLVSINGGDYEEVNANSFDFSDMNTGDSIEFTIIAIDNGPCGNSEEDSLKCFAVNCPEVDLSITRLPDICLENDLQPITLNAEIIGNIEGEETFNWTGTGIIDRDGGIFDPVEAGPGEHEIFLTYRVTVCPYQASTVITVISSPEIDFDFASPACFGINDGSVTINEVTGGDAPYTFSVDGGPPTTSMEIGGLRPGEHTILVTDVNGCSNIYSFVLDQPEELTVDIGGSYIIDGGDSLSIVPEFNISVDSIVEYNWTGSEFITCPTCETLEVVPDQQSMVTLVVTDVNGCVATDRATIFVKEKRRVFIPSGFTPDDDGVNDRFTIFAAEEVESVKSLKIFDRWGSMVFENSDFPPNVESEGWDGTFKGSMLRPGVFVYHAVIEYKDGVTEDIYGDITLLSTEGR